MSSMAHPFATRRGGPESLVIRPARSSHRDVTPETRRQAGVTDGLIRLSVGIEAVQDIIPDLWQALGSEK